MISRSIQPFGYLDDKGFELFKDNFEASVISHSIQCKYAGKLGWRAAATAGWLWPSGAGQNRLQVAVADQSWPWLAAAKLWLARRQIVRCCIRF
nr:hypothetical protein SO190N17_000003 [Saccharum officinarum]